MTLHGPADPDIYRVQIGRYKERFYHDPLPADPTWPAWAEAVPSVSTVKGAWPKFLTKWTAEETATCAVDDHDAWIQLDRDAAISHIANAAERSKHRAGRRGTKLHRVMEDAISGQPPLDPVLTLDVEPWLPACQQFVDDCQPRLVASEAVVIRRGDDECDGYGGTFDAIVTIGDGTYLVDWKTRQEGKAGTRWEDEAAQLAAYANADYMIVTSGDGDAIRTGIPGLTGLLIVTLAPDGYRIHPVLPDPAWESFRALRRFHDTRRLTVFDRPITLKEAVSSPPKSSPSPGGSSRSSSSSSPAAPPSSSEPATSPSTPANGSPTSSTPTSSTPSVKPAPTAPATDGLALHLENRYTALVDIDGGRQAAITRWPPNIPGPKNSDKWTPDMLPLIDQALTRAEADVAAPFPAPYEASSEPVEPLKLDTSTPTDVEAHWHQAEGGPAPQQELDQLAADLVKLTPNMRVTVLALIDELGLVEGRHAALPTVTQVRRRQTIVALDGDDDLIRTALRHRQYDATGDVAHDLAALTLPQAIDLWQLALQIAEGLVVPNIHPDGTWTLNVMNLDEARMVRKTFGPCENEKEEG